MYNMEKSKQVEQVSLAVQESLKQFSAFPRMYHPTEDLISIPLIVDGKKVVVEIKTRNK